MIAPARQLAHRFWWQRSGTAIFSLKFIILVGRDCLQMTRTREKILCGQMCALIAQQVLSQVLRAASIHKTTKFQDEHCALCIIIHSLLIQYSKRKHKTTIELITGTGCRFALFSVSLVQKTYTISQLPLAASNLSDKRRERIFSNCVVFSNFSIQFSLNFGEVRAKEIPLFPAV